MGRERYHSTRRNGGKTMVSIPERFVPRANVQPLQKHLAKAAGQTNRRIPLKLCRSMDIIGRQNPFGEAMVLPSCDFINSIIAPKVLVRAGLGRCHSTQFNDRNIARLISSYSLPCATCHWHVTRVLTLLILVLERLDEF